MSAGALPNSIASATRLLHDGTLTVTELVRSSLARAHALQGDLNAFITITDDDALQHAATLDQELRAGLSRGSLHGIPIAHKDCLDTAGIRTTRGTRYFADHLPMRSATVVKKLEQAGCVMIGKTNMKELAAGGSGDNEFFGAVRNPWDPSRSPGGSSSGTAVAIAAGIVLGGTGTDSGGSIRAPASWNGIVGIRPTAGLVSTSGCFPRSYSFDCVGPLARTVDDATTLLGVMAGHDPIDRASAQRPLEDYAAALHSHAHALRAGIVEGYSRVDVDQSVLEAFDAACAVLRDSGMEVVNVDVPSITREFDYRALFDILQHEFALILGSDYDACADREHVFGRYVRANMRRGREVGEGTYRAALDNRAATTARIRRVFAQVDVLLTPSQPLVAQPFDRPDEVFDRCRQFMLPFSFAGLPALSVPCGFDHDGLPIGLQIVADQFQESTMLRVASAYASRTDYTLRRPPARH